MYYVYLPSSGHLFIQWNKNNSSFTNIDSVLWNYHPQDPTLVGMRDFCYKLMTVWNVFKQLIFFPHLGNSSVKDCHLVVFKIQDLRKKLL